jgi:hypothetical protein
MKPLKFVFNYKKVIAIDRDSNEEIMSYYPVVPCVFEYHEKKSMLLEGLLDSGADGIVMPLALAELLELDLEPAVNPMMVVGDKGIERYLSKANMTIGRGGRTVDFKNVEVSIPKKGDTPILIGRNPVFKHYEITFIEAEKKFVMKPYKKK